MTLAIKTHPLKIPVNHSLAVDVDQSVCDAPQLDRLSTVNGLQTKPVKLLGEKPTRFNRFVSGYAFTK